MSNSTLRLCTVDDAYLHYLNNYPMLIFSFQDYGVDKIYNVNLESDNKVILTNLGKSPTELELEFFIFDGSLRYINSKTGKTEIIEKWLDNYEEGPYLEEMESSHMFVKTNRLPVNFYYLGGYHSKWGYNWIQVCSSPLNILSEDCLDSINLWTFGEINLSVPKDDF